MRLARPGRYGVVAMVSLIVCLASATQAQVCGDYDCSGHISAPDTYTAFNYIAEGSPSCGSFDHLDIDGHARITTRDAVWIARHYFAGGQAPDCESTGPELLPQPSQDFFLMYDDQVTQCGTGLERCTVVVEMINHEPFHGALLSIALRLDGQPLDSGEYHSFDVRGGHSGRAEWYFVGPGLWLIGYSRGSPIPPGRHLVGWFLSDSNWEGRQVELEFTNGDSLFYDSAIARYTMAVDGNLDVWEIRSGETECPIRATGDGDMSGTLTSSDIITLVNYVFKSGPFPLPCAAAGDVDCDTSVTSSDVIYLVNHIFKGDSAPCDVCSIYAQSECE